MSSETASHSEMPTRRLGRTGVEVSLIGLGGWHLGFRNSDEQLSIRITMQAASRGQYELFKTTSIYDGTATHPEWLGEEPPEVQRVIQA